MAGLKMNVELPTRLCEVKGELGYFHLWEQWSNVVDASLLRGGHPAGQIGQVYGIVEFKDGVRRVDPVSIKFCCTGGKSSTPTRLVRLPTLALQCTRLRTSLSSWTISLTSILWLSPKRANLWVNWMRIFQMRHP